MSRIKFCKIAALALSLSMVINTSVFASTQSPSSLPNSKNYSYISGKNNMNVFNLKTQLDVLVTSSTITQTQEDTVLNILTPAKGINGLKSKLHSLNTSSTISQALKDAIDKLATTETDNSEPQTELVRSASITKFQQEINISASSPSNKSKL